jgi:hypothetical protein
MTDAGALQAAIELGAERLEKAAGAIHHATIEAGEAEHAYEKALEKELLTIYHEAKRAGERMPAEDVRRAIAHEQIEDEVYALHLHKKAHLAAQEKLFKGLQAALSARQSLLRFIGGIG